MKYSNDNTEMFKCLKADCENCFGFCCVALYFSASEGFPHNKDAGEPCTNLQPDFRCGVHKSLKEMGLKGCIAYDCFGAGQKVAKVTFEGSDWKQAPELAKKMYEVFLKMRQIHEMLWYLTEAYTLKQVFCIQKELKSLLNKTKELTFLSPDSLLELNVSEYRKDVNLLLSKTSKLVRDEFIQSKKSILRGQKSLGRGFDLMGADLRKTDLRGADLRGAYLIAANLRGMDLSGADFIGADLRDADLRGSDLSKSIFLTQAQINTAKGDFETKLPVWLTRPRYWSK